MALTAQQLTYLRNADQRFQAHIALFPAYAPTITAPNPGAGTSLALKPMPMVSPRHSVVANGGAITLSATDSFNRGGAYVGDANIAWVNTGGNGTLVDNGDGTATYTAPANGTDTNLITMTATNSNGTKDALCYVAYPKTTYDALIAEVASISGSASQHGWTIAARIRGDTADFVIGAIILLHIDDTWGATANTFGGYKYSEGVFCGYITQAEYFEDWGGERWLGIVAESSWSKLQKIQINETMWGKTKRTGRYYIKDFRPIDALWYLLSETTDFCSRHNCTLFYDTNIIDDFIIGRGTDSRVSLADIIDDVMGRGLAIAYTDRYSSLLCIPDPDVRSAEWWGTPSPIYDGSGPLTEAYCKSYSVNYYDIPAVRRMALIAFDSYRLGMWAACQASAGTQGTDEKIQGLLCDDTLKLAQWASEKRAQLNKPWDITVDTPLNHTLDIYNPLIAIFTAPAQQGGNTASGLCWIDSISYRPTMDGGWAGQWRIVKNTQSDTGANGEVSGWGGSGQWGVGGSGLGIAPAGWATSIPQSDTTWEHLFDWESGSGLFTSLVNPPPLQSGTAGIWVSGYGWSATQEWDDNWEIWAYIWRSHSTRTLTGVTLWYSASEIAGIRSMVVNSDYYEASSTHIISTAPPTGTGSAYTAAIISGVSGLAFIYAGVDNDLDKTGTAGCVLKSALVGGIGTDPFG